MTRQLVNRRRSLYNGPVAQAHRTQGVAAAKMPKERLAQLDRLAARRGVTRSWLLREAAERLLEESDERLTPDEQSELEQRRRNAEGSRRLGEIRRNLRPRLGLRLDAADLRRSMAK